MLVAGLVLSVVLMGSPPTWSRGLLERYRWIAWVGLLIVLYIALSMIWPARHEVARAM